MVEIKLLKATYAGPNGGDMIKRKPQLPLKKEHEQPNFLKHRSGTFKRGIEIDLLNFKVEDFYKIIVISLKNTNNTALRLYNRSYSSDGEFEPVRFRSSDPKTCIALQRFTRALAQAVGVGGWLQELELGFSLWRQDIKVLSQGLVCSSNLRRISFANSALGDEKLQLLAQGLCECHPLQVLDLSGCALTDASYMPLTSILRAVVRRTVDAEWQSSLRESGGSRVQRRTLMQAGGQGLTSLDLSFNVLSDVTSRQLCYVMRLGAPLAVLNLQGNQLRRKSAQLFLSVFEALGVLRLVDLRKNLDGKDVGVLEDGKHLRSFSKRHAPFWNSTSLWSRHKNIPLEQKSSMPITGKPSPQRNCLLRSVSERDLATSDELSTERVSAENPSCTRGDQNREYLDRRAFLNWSSGTLIPANPMIPRDLSQQERESNAKKSWPPKPHRHVGDETSGPVSTKSLIPSLHLWQDPLVQASSINGGNQTTTSPSLYVDKEYPDLLESNNKERDSVDDLSLLYPNKQESNQLGEKSGEVPSRPLSPSLVDPATPELTNRNHPIMASKADPQENTELPSRTAPDEQVLSNCQPVQRSDDVENCECAPRLENDVKRLKSAGRSQPNGKKTGNSSQIHSKRLASKDRNRRAETKPCNKNQLIGGKELGQDKQDTKKKVPVKDLKRKSMQQTHRFMQYGPENYSTEWQRKELEWCTFMWDMTRTLIHLQEGLDVLIKSSQSDAHISA